MSNKRKYVWAALKISVSILLVGYLLYTAWTNEQFDALMQGRVDLVRYGGALALAFAAILITFIRWYFLVVALGLPFRLWDAIRFGFVGYFFNFTTVGTVGGDALRAFFVARQTPGHRTEAIATVVFDRAIGLVALFMLTGTALLLIDLKALCGEDLVTYSALTFCRWFSVVAGAGGTLGLAFLCGFRAFRDWRLWQLLFGLPWVGDHLHRLYDAGMVYASRPRVVIGTYVASFPVHILNSLSVYLIAASLPVTHPSLLMHFAAVPLANLAAVLPLPGGIGAFEFMLAALYRAMAQMPEDADHGLLVAFGFRLITILIASVGVLIYFAERREIDDLQHESEEELA